MRVLTSSQIKNAEKATVQSGLFSYTDLMKKAADAVFCEIQSRYSIVGKKFLILVGGGNNGGDGLALADLLRSAGAFVTLYLTEGFPNTDAARKFVARAQDIPVSNYVSDDYDFYIDAIFGIGLNRMLSNDAELLLNRVNGFKGVRIAIDIPTGLIADGGMTQTAFKADLTVTFIGYKLCQLLPDTSDYCGNVVLNDIGIEVANEYSYKIIEAPKPRIYGKSSHKGTFGTAVLFSGSYGMCGAEILAAKAALVSGAGIIKAVVCDKNYSAFTSAVPEAVALPVETSPEGLPVLYDKTVLSAISGASAVLFGCGSGRGDEVNMLLKKILEFSNIPIVIDADGINAVSRDISILRNSNAPLILTPHPGEMARLCGTTTEDIEKHRIQYAKRIACEYNCVLVLKGANTIVASPDGELYFNLTGNYGMAKGGSGDVLSGIIVSLLANGYDPLSAALTAVYVHGMAGDNAAKKYTKRAMLPSDIIEELKFISF